MSYKRKGRTLPEVVVASEGGNFEITAGADPALVIEAAWSYLNSLGGGIIQTTGPGETWVAQTKIDSQGEKVKWISDWSLKIELDDAVDAHLISISHDDVELNGLNLDGNKTNQTGYPGGAEFRNVYCTGADQFKMLNCYSHHAAQYGVSWGTAVDAILAWNYFSENGWNGLEVTLNGVDAKVFGNHVDHSSDAGLATFGINTLMQGNTVIDMDRVDGSTNTGWGIEIARGTKHQAIGNSIHDCGLGLGVQGATPPTDVLVVGNVIYDIDTTCIVLGHTGIQCLDNKIYVKTAFERGIIAESTSEDCLIKGNEFSGVADYYGIDVDAQDKITIDGNMFRGTPNRVIQFDNPSLECSVINNTLLGGTTGVYATTGDVVDDLTIQNNRFYDMTTAIYLRQGNDVMITGNRMRNCTTVLDANVVAMVRTMLMGNNWEGSTNDPITGAMNNPRITSNIDKTGAWWATGDNPA